MKVKTSVTLSAQLVSAIDKRARKLRKNRSEFIEVAVSAFIMQIDRRELNARDIDIIARHADSLNAEAEDVLGFQVIP